MKYKYSKPLRIMIVFKPFDDGKCRNPLTIPLCTEIKTGKTIIVKYIARDNCEHQHFYNKHNINNILIDDVENGCVSSLLN